MDNAKIEFVVEQEIQADGGKFISELADLQLALVSGGAGDVLF